MTSRPIPTRDAWRGRPVLYRCHDVDGRLIYIGSTSSMWDRLMQHRHDSWWLPLLATLRMQVFSSIEAARLAERSAIVAELPAFNVRPLRNTTAELVMTLRGNDLLQWRRSLRRRSGVAWDVPAWVQPTRLPIARRALRSAA